MKGGGGGEFILFIQEVPHESESSEPIAANDNSIYIWNEYSYSLLLKKHRSKTWVPFTYFAA